MKLDTVYNSLILSDLELSAMGQYFNLPPNKLTLIPHVQLSSKERQSAITAYNSLEQTERELLSAGLAMLVAPDEAGTLHYSIGDRSLSRLLLGCTVEDSDHLAVLAKQGEMRSLSLRSYSEITHMLAQVLAADSTVATFNFSLSLSAIATIVFLALSDCYCAAWYRSLLSHTIPVESFTLQEIAERIEDTAADFRWPFLFFAKVLPVDIASELTRDDVIGGLEELSGLNLVVKNEGEARENEPVLYSLGEEAELISDGLRTNAGKVALNISTVNVDNKIGHESVLFVRDANYLWLFDITGNRGAIASIDSDTFNDLLHKMLTPPTIKAPTSPEAEMSAGAVVPEVGEVKSEDKVDSKIAATVPSKEPVSANRCSQCGKELLPEADFCHICGAPVKRGEAALPALFCHKCGQKLEPDDVFCAGCGAKL